RFESGPSEELGRESELGVSQDLIVSEEKGALAAMTAPIRGEDKVSREVLIAQSVPKGAQMTENGIAWLGEDGAIYVHNADGKEYALRPAQGQVREFALSRKNNHIYVLAGDSLQRWDLASNKATVLSDERIEASRLSGLSVRQGENGAEIAEARSASLRVALKEGVLSRRPETARTVHDEFGAVSWLKASGDSLYIQKLDGGSRIWRKSFDDPGASVSDLGTLPFEVKAVVEGPANGILFAATEEGLVEWDTRGARSRLFQVPGLRDAARGGSIRLEISADAGQALLSAGSKFFRLDLFAARAYLDGDEARVRLWAQENPMSISGGKLRIGAFTFPIRTKEPVKRPWRARAWSALKRALGLGGAPAEAEAAGFSEKEWKAVNLPTNKWVIYQTLKAFTLRQHVLYIGETGGGKTWVSEMLAKLTGNDLWMASLNEYTKNQDLIARETFGEEGKNKTGLTPSVVLQWMMNGGILLLDEMHKPLEGIAVLNNILQNGEYRMADGRVIRYDKSKSFVIGTMNPVKPPYRGEPPSGELSSRFGMTLEVKYLPAEEEAALLSIFHDKVPKALLEKLVAIANDLRKVYPETLPLPIAPRTLMHIAQHMSLFPNDDPADIFTATYNPASIVEDPAIQKAIRKALEAHGFGRQAEKKSPVTPKA
ncbi:MAG: AAA family ATPase, partial [Elusimicrobiota bacterium]